jgi:hypothetical protein
VASSVAKTLAVARTFAIQAEAVDERGLAELILDGLVYSRNNLPEGVGVPRCHPFANGRPERCGGRCAGHDSMVPRIPGKILISMAFGAEIAKEIGVEARLAGSIMASPMVKQRGASSGRP